MDESWYKFNMNYGGGITRISRDTRQGVAGLITPYHRGEGGGGRYSYFWYHVIVYTHDPLYKIIKSNNASSIRPIAPRDRLSWFQHVQLCMQAQFLNSSRLNGKTFSLNQYYLYLYRVQAYKICLPQITRKYRIDNIA